VFFNKDPQKAAEKQAAKAEKKQRRDEAAEQRAADKASLKEWRAAHPAEATMNMAALMKMWPSSKMGVTTLGPVKGGSAEFVNAGAHKGWTATRLIAGVATAGVSAAATGRKNKGAAVINVTFGNGAAQTYTVKPEPSYLKAANQYVNAFNALAAQLDQEDEGAEA
jgi:acetoin utilization deacetylase AcuC-like enzyme